MELYERNGNILYILNVLKKYSDVDHILKATDIQRKVNEIYDVDIDPRTIRRIIALLKYKFEYEISTRDENGKGYYIGKNPETDFEEGEIRAIIDNFSYASYIVPSVAKSIIVKCKNLQNVYENEKIKNYRIFSTDNKTDNMEVIKNIEDIEQAIQNSKKIEFEYWKYFLDYELKKHVEKSFKVSPYALVFNKQQFYMIAIVEGLEEFYHFRLDRIKNIRICKDKIVLKKSKEQIQDFVESTVEMFGGEKDAIKIKCKMELLDSVIDVFGKSIILQRIDDNYFYMIVHANPLGFKMWAMRNIDMIEVIEPLYLRNEIKKIIQEAKEKYN